MHRISWIFLLILILAGPLSAQAQELPPPENPNPLENQGETAPPPPPADATTEESGRSDTESNANEVERELFGTDAPEETGDEETANGSHMLRFEFSGTAQFIEQAKRGRDDFATGEPYLEISYVLRFETPVDVSLARKTRKLDVEMDVTHWGTLARNEFFECRLEIDMPEIPVEITTRMQEERPDRTEGEVDEDDIKRSLALKLDFSRDVQEDWFSLCSDFGTSNLNTQGEAESYHAELFKLVDPALSSIFVEEFDPDDTTQIDLTVTPKIIDDRDIANDILLSGEGTITLDPL